MDWMCKLFLYLERILVMAIGINAEEKLLIGPIQLLVGMEYSQP